MIEKNIYVLRSVALKAAVEAEAARDKRLLTFLNLSHSQTRDWLIDALHSAWPLTCMYLRWPHLQRSFLVHFISSPGNIWSGKH